MKKAIQVISVLCLSVVMAVSSFAFTLPEEQFKIENKNYLLGEFDTVNMNTTAKELMEKWIKSDYKFFSTGDYSYYWFYVMLNDDDSIALSNKNYGYYCSNVNVKNGEVNIRFDKGNNLKFAYVRFKYNSSKKIFEYVNYDYAIGFDMSTHALILVNISDKFDKLKPIPEICKLECDTEYEKVGFYDNGGLFSSPEPPEPSEPSEPEEPKPPVVIPPVTPSIPKGDGKYICYDTSVWTGFLDYVLKAIGNGTNVGLRAFYYILGIWIVIWVVRKFTK